MGASPGGAPDDRVRAPQWFRRRTFIRALPGSPFRDLFTMAAPIAIFPGVTFPRAAHIRVECDMPRHPRIPARPVRPASFGVKPSMTLFHMQHSY
jgi:hypothetical protein